MDLLRFFYFLSFLTFFTACSSISENGSFSVTQIDKPYTVSSSFVGSEYKPAQQKISEAKPVVAPIQVVYNQRVRHIIDFYLYRRLKGLKKGIRRSGMFFPTISRVLQEEQAPANLIYLAGVESNYQIRARSRAHALGMWQFIRSTALEFDLKSNQWIDERYDVESSTRAAAKYLKYLHKRFQSWELAMAAYNAGETRVASAMSKAKRHGKNTDYWSIIHYLPRETRSYVPAFMALNIIFNNLESFGLSDVKRDKPLLQERVVISTKYSPYEVAQRLKLRYYDVKALNHFLIRDIPPLTQKEYYLYIPKGYRVALENSLNQNPKPIFAKWKIQASHAYRSSKMIRLLQQHGDRFYVRVRRGDSLWSLAKKYRTTIAHLRAWNNIYGTSHLHIGKTISLYAPNWNFFQKLGVYQKQQIKKRAIPKSTYKYRSVQQINLLAKYGDRFHIRVRRGDSLSTIAKRYRTTIRHLVRWNNIKNISFLRIGQRLVAYTPNSQFLQKIKQT